MRSVGDNANMFYGAKPEIFERAKNLRNSLTPAEEILWKYLSHKKLGVRFQKQHPINSFIADFYCHELKLVIEIDGDIHDLVEAKDYDIGRTGEMNKFGITVIRFRNQEVFNAFDEVIERIQKSVAERH
jgi:very-short-patch-repair endonuclease